MHYGTPKFRRAGAAGPTDIAIINASESAEHQAKVFASAFLIHDEAAAKLSGPEQISTEFLVSLEAAEICFERLTERAERIRAAERVEKATLAFKEEVRTEAHAISYLKDLCTRCGKAMLVPIGIKFLCMNCDFVSDQFQDGDRND